jgi:hypothetical protein
MMKSILITLMAVALAQTAFGELTFEQTEIVHEAGLMDERVEALFKFTNEGELPVTITNLKSSCGCTVPQLEKKDYLPGESGEIKAIFTFGARIGTQHKRINVQTDEPEGGRYTLSLVTKIPEWVVIEPRILRWKTGEQAAPQRIRVSVMDPEKVQVELPVAQLKHFEMTREQGADGDKAQIFTIKPKSVTERATEFLKFTATITDGSTKRNKLFGVHCLVR